ncbi:hypothetical protein ACQKKX_04490 [Neorhizobium sp. NPDC001467]|uniref:hypothetical protein n=1 Tax=Neorhizobium sp. NPDC001467 TaxID=3390595 RepID=UPI003CFCA044
MMAPRKPKPAPDTAAGPFIEQPTMNYITNPVIVAHTTPRTRDEIAIRDVASRAIHVLHRRAPVIETAASDDQVLGLLESAEAAGQSLLRIPLEALRHILSASLELSLELLRVPLAVRYRHLRPPRNHVVI